MFASEGAQWPPDLGDAQEVAAAAIPQFLQELLAARDAFGAGQARLQEALDRLEQGRRGAVTAAAGTVADADIEILTVAPTVTPLVSQSNSPGRSSRVLAASNMDDNLSKRPVLLPRQSDTSLSGVSSQSPTRRPTNPFDVALRP